MDYRILGRTGIKVSEIGFGCGNVGGLMIRGSEYERVEAVRRSVELGINYFDTAPSYGNGKSETNLGKVLRELEPDVIVATKVGLSLGDVPDIFGVVQRSVEDSLSRLQRDSVDVIQLHSRVAVNRGGGGWESALGVSDVLGENGVAAAFESIREQGLTRFLGFTGIGETAALYMLVDSGRFDVVQAYVNLINPSAGWEVSPSFYGHNFGRIIDRAWGKGLGVAAIRVMAAGAVGGVKARQGYASPKISQAMIPGGEYSEDQDKAAKLSFLFSKDISSLPQASIRFVLSHPGVSLALVGFSSIEQIEDAVACSGRGPLPESSINRLKKLWTSNFLL
jgi:aryl-alcohol dehydrogenase-like predicted oxidoreductase